MSTLTAEILTRDEGLSTDMRAVAAKHEIRSMVAAGMQIRGNIISKSGAAIDGGIIGTISVVAPNAALLIRASAVVHGTIRAPICMIAGTVKGDVIGRFVRLYPGAKVIGNIHAERLIVDDGAIVQNASMIAGPTAAAAKSADPVVSLWRHAKDVAQGAGPLVNRSDDQSVVNSPGIRAG